MTTKWKEILGNVAPMIGGALGGSLGEMAVGMAASALGLPAGSSEAAVAQAVANMTPEQQLALRAADGEFEVRKEALYVEMKKAEHADRKDARAMQRAMASWIVPFLAILTVVGFFGTIAALFLLGQQVSEGTRDVLMIMIGILGTVTIGVYNFYFGSSEGSRQKTEMLEK